MAGNFLRSALRTSYLGAVVLGTVMLRANTDDSFEPNYANRMLTPIEGSNVAPKLIPPTGKFPLRVIVVSNPYTTDAYYDAVKDACRAWGEATRPLAAGKVGLTCEERDDPTGADIVICLCTREDNNEFVGYTSKYDDYSVIRLSAFDAEGKSVLATRIRQVAMHELGHALGIWGHSPNSTDIMAAHPQTSQISAADINTLKLAYSLKSSSRATGAP